MFSCILFPAKRDGWNYSMLANGRCVIRCGDYYQERQTLQSTARERIYFIEVALGLYSVIIKVRHALRSRNILQIYGNTLETRFCNEKMQLLSGSSVPCMIINVGLLRLLHVLHKKMQFLSCSSLPRMMTNVHLLLFLCFFLCLQLFAHRRLPFHFFLCWIADRVNPVFFIVFLDLGWLSFRLQKI